MILNHELRTFLLQRLNPEQVYIVLASGANDVKDIRYLTGNMLPHELPAIKLSRLVQECIGAVPMPTLPVVVHAPAVARQFEAAPVDLKKHWSKAYNGALKIARECLVSAHNSQRMGYFSLGRNARIFF